MAPILALLIAAAALAGQSHVHAEDRGPDVSILENSAAVPLHEVFEITFTHGGKPGDPFFDVTVSVTFASPSGRRVEIGGFHYKEDAWKARFAPSETGGWTYSWVFEDGSPYFPIGLQECLGDHDHHGSLLAACSLEGPFRLDRKGIPDPPPGAMFKPGPAMNPQNGDVYFRRYGRSGFNLFRFSQKNCSPDLYIHHSQDHREPLKGLRVTLEVPKAARGYWYSPETAAILSAFDAPAGRGTFAVPDFRVDIALLITSSGAPDVDGDGIPNDLDPDDDGDGVPDAKDAFPLESEEWEDRDGDQIGDNLDADIDADGKGDDRNGNGSPDHEELDIDGDGIGDNADPDDDGDGSSDEEERAAGTDPLDRLSFPGEKR